MEQQVIDPPLSKTTSDKKFFTEKQANLAGFIGGPVSAGVIFYCNYRRLGNIESANKALLISIAFTIILFTILFQLPEETVDKIPNILFALFYGLLSAVLFKKFLSEDIKAVFEQGAKKASNWSVVGLSVGGFLFTLLLIFMMALNEPPFPGKKMTFGNVGHEVFYNSGTVTIADVEQVAHQLTLTEFFNDEYQQVVHLGKVPEGFILTIPIEKMYWEDKELIGYAEELKLYFEDKFSSPFFIRLEDYTLSGTTIYKTL